MIFYLSKRYKINVVLIELTGRIWIEIEGNQVQMGSAETALKKH
jgi:hypothetical protein